MSGAVRRGTVAGSLATKRRVVPKSKVASSTTSGDAEVFDYTLTRMVVPGFESGRSSRPTSNLFDRICLESESGLMESNLPRMNLERTDLSGSLASESNEDCIASLGRWYASEGSALTVDYDEVLLQHVAPGLAKHPRHWKVLSSPGEHPGVRALSIRMEATSALFASGSAYQKGRTGQGKRFILAGYPGVVVRTSDVGTWEASPADLENLRPLVRSLLASASEDVFESGIVSPLNHGIAEAVSEFAELAVQALEQEIEQGQYPSAIIHEVAIALSMIADTGTHGMRRSMLEEMLSSQVPEVRDGAILGLERMSDATSCEALGRALKAELIEELRANLRYVLDELRARAAARI
jgi:hypothetical protein